MKAIIRNVDLKKKRNEKDFSTQVTTRPSDRYFLFSACGSKHKEDRKPSRRHCIKLVLMMHRGCALRPTYSLCV